MDKQTIELCDLLIDQWSVPKGRSSFSLFLDDLLVQLGWNGYRHPAPLSPEERSLAFRSTQLYGNLVASSLPFSDILGPVCQELACKGHQKALGQYFSPEGVCDLTAALTIDQNQDANRPLTFNEPAAGAGGMALATCRYALSNGISLKQVCLMLNDIDITCVKMMSAQFLTTYLFHDKTPGYLSITHGDIFKMELKPFLLLNAYSSSHSTASSVEPLYPSQIDSLRTHN